jgi:nucleoside-diphosphate-sugar epimerase
MVTTISKMVYLWDINYMAKKKKNLKKYILITGGSGFIGSAITKYLVQRKNKVIVFDNNSRGKLVRLKEVKNKIKFIKGDIRNRKKLLSIRDQVDTVIHLAYVNGTKFFYRKPFEILDIAVNGLINILDFCKKKKVKNFYLASSSEVYQNPFKIPTNEEEMLKIPSIYNPRYSYGGGKIISELYGLHFAKKFLKKFIIFRPHNVYGKDMGNDHVIPEFINRLKKLRNKEKFLIYGTGKEVRSFIYIDDFVHGFDKIFKRGKNQEIYNIGTNDKITISKLAKLIAKVLRKNIKFKKRKGLKGSPSIRCPDIKKIKKLGFKHNISLKNGIKKILN